jgi:haloalkane dehalogenase
MMTLTPHAIRPSWVDKDLFPFESHFVEIDGNLVHYIDEGSGPLLLMLHGNPTWSFVYRDVIRVLRDSFRCVALDYPGFGLSIARPGYGHLPQEHADAVVGFIDRMEMSEVTLVAQDWGGPIGICAAERRPEAFRGLILANTWAWPVNGDFHFEAFSRVMGGPLGGLLIRRFNLFVNLMIPAGHKRRKVSPPEMAHYRAALPTPARRHASAVFPREIIRSRAFLEGVQERLSNVNQLPSLLIWADADIAFRKRELERWEIILNNHELALLHGAGHFLQSDAPREFAEAILAWHPVARDQPTSLATGSGRQWNLPE